MSYTFSENIEKSPRIGRLIDHLFEKMPEIEADRAVLLTESYKATEGQCKIIVPFAILLPILFLSNDFTYAYVFGIIVSRTDKRAFVFQIMRKEKQC